MIALVVYNTFLRDKMGATGTITAHYPPGADRIKLEKEAKESVQSRQIIRLNVVEPLIMSLSLEDGSEMKFNVTAPNGLTHAVINNVQSFKNFSAIDEGTRIRFNDVVFSDIPDISFS